MKVLLFTLFFPPLFCGFTEFLYGKTPAGTMALPEESHPFPPLYYALVSHIPSAGNVFINAAEAFERDHFPNKENFAGSDPVWEQLLLNRDPKNKAPKAHAGNYKDLTDEDGNGKESLQLDGSKSSDKDGQIVSYSWTIEGTNTELVTGVNPVADFSVGSTWIVLTVTDNGGLTDSDKVKIKVKEGKGKDDGGKDQDDEDKDDKDKEEDEDEGDKNEDKEDNENDEDKEDDKDNDDKDEDDDKDDDDKDEGEDEEEEPANKAPVADAGKDMQLEDEDRDGKENVKLNGSKSKDEDGSIESYSWSVAGKEIAEGKNPSVDLEKGTHIVKLTVTDNGGLTDTDEVQISISAPANKAPEANAGADQEKTDTDRNGKESIELDGSASKDPDGSIEEYSWKVKGAEIATGVKPVVELSTGTTQIELTVTDNDGSTATDKVKITIKEAPNQAPVARAGENQTLTTEGEAGTMEVKLDGSGSTDPDGEIENYSWSVAGTEIATGKKPTVTLVTGVHSITLTVTDNEGSKDTDETKITINMGESEEEEDDDEEEEKPANKAPVAHAGADQELTDTDGNGKETVKLDATASTDEDGSITSYSWSIEGSETILATGATPEAELPAGSNIIVLRVTDEKGATHTDTVVILIKEMEEEEETPEGGEETEGEENEETGGEGDEEGTEGGEETEEENGGEEGNAFLPNLFSPNGDNMNDEFTLEATHVAEVHLRIYNRQGRLVYETQDVKEAAETGWDGNAFGGPQPAGSYVWILEGIYTDGSPILIDGEIKGNVTLIR